MICYLNRDRPIICPKSCRDSPEPVWLNQGEVAGGGFTLGVNARDIRLMDIWIALEGTFETSICPYRENGCKLSTCLFGTVGKDASELIRKYFNETTVQFIGKLLEENIDQQL